MGLRKLLGLPPKPPKTVTPAARTTGDPATYDAAKLKYDQVTGHDAYALLTDAQQATLKKAKEEADGLIAHDLYDDAAKRLNDAVGATAGQIVKAKAAKVDFDATKPKITGVIDGAQLLGVPADHIKLLRDQYNAITAAADDDIVAAAQALAKLGRDIAADETIKAAKAARDKVMADKDRVEAEAAEALKVAQETPAVLKQHRILADAVSNIGPNAGKLNYLEAVRYMDVCEACIVIINAEAPGIAAAIALRDDVTAKRKLLDADVDAARLIYGTTDEAEGLISQFQSLDKAFEGAMHAKDYKIAQTLLARLDSAAKRVLELKPAMVADEQARADHKAELKDVRKDIKAVRKIPAVTGELERILAPFNVKVTAYFAAYNAKEWEKATALAAEIKAQSAEYVAAGDDAADELAKDTEKVALWKSDCKSRYSKLSKIKGTLPDMVTALADAEAAFEASNKQSTDKDFTAALASMKTLKGLLDTIDGLKAANADARKNRVDGWKEYKKSKALFDEALAIKPKTPEMAALYKTFVDAHDAFDAARKRGEDGVEDQLPAIIVAAQAVVDGKDDNTAGEDEGKAAVSAAKSASIAAYQAAKAIAEKYLPASQAELDAQTAAVVQFNNLNKAGRYMEAVEAIKQLTAACTAITDAEAGWEAAAVQVKADYDLRYAPVKTDYDKVAAYQPVLPGLDTEIAAATALKLKADTEYAAGNMGKASAELDKLTASVAALVAKKAAHDTGVADKAWVAAKKTSIGSDVDDAKDGFALIPETQDIQARIKYAFDVAAAAETKHDYAAVRVQWVELERLQGLWAAKEADNDAAWTADARAVSTQLRTFKDERTAAGDIDGITPELKKLKGTYLAASKRFWGAYSARDWTLALELIVAYEAAVKALAAKEADYDAAKLAAAPVAAAATQALTDISDADLKAKPTDEKLKLLDDMRATGDDLTDAQRKLQRKLYSSLDYDPAFKQADEKRRDELVDALKADSDVMEARGKWGAMDDDARLAVLIKVMNAECKVFNIPPPAVRLFYEPPGDEGFFSGATMTLNLNTHPDSGWTDYKEAVNTVVHENMHNYQEVLVRRLNEGIITKEDPEYVQALIFASNDAPGGYVDTDEKPDPDEANQKPYKTQPVEAHAWDSGDGVAAELMAADAPDEDEEY